MPISIKALRSDLEALQSSWDFNDHMTISYEITGMPSLGFVHISACDPDGKYLCGDYADIIYEQICEIAQKHDITFQDDRTFRTSSEFFLYWSLKKL